jgi:hypothetical protein
VAGLAAIFSTGKPDLKPMFEAAMKLLIEQPGDAQFCRTMGFVRFAAGSRSRGDRRRDRSGRGG